MTDDKSGTLTGRRLGGYQLSDKLGQGGMGAVYKARDLSLQRTVAVKVLPAALAADPTYVRRFVREARTLARLNHPNLVHIYQVGQKDGLYYFAMEYVEGRTLNQVLRASGALPVAEFLRCAGQILAALQKIHGAGLTHRDIKSGNVIVENGTGRAVLMDFGLAKDRASSPPDEAGLTSAGVVLGTPEYMSPEQAEGREVDARSDIYAFGIMAYEMLIGRVPFTGKSAIAVLRQQAESAPPPLRERRPELPAELEPVIARSLAKDPAERYASAAELAVDLVRIGHTPELAELAASDLPPTARTIVNMPVTRPAAGATRVERTGAGPALLPDSGHWQRQRTTLLLGLAATAGFALALLLVLLGVRGCRRPGRAAGPEGGSANVTVQPGASRPDMEGRFFAADGRSVRVRVIAIEGALATVQELDEAGRPVGGPVSVRLRDFERFEPDLPAPREPARTPPPAGGP